MTFGTFIVLSHKTIYLRLCGAPVVSATAVAILAGAVEARLRCKIPEVLLDMCVIVLSTFHYILMALDTKQTHALWVL